MDATFLPQWTGVGRLGEDASLELDHIGIAVRSIAAARTFYEMLGMKASAPEVIAQESVRAAMLPVGSTRLELLEPLTENSVVGRFLERRGEGMHHIALRVQDIEAKFEQLKAAGLRLVGDAIQLGAGGHRYFFVHPASTGGVLIEIVGRGSGNLEST